MRPHVTTLLGSRLVATCTARSPKAASCSPFNSLLINSDRPKNRRHSTIHAASSSSSSLELQQPQQQAWLCGQHTPPSVSSRSHLCQQRRWFAGHNKWSKIRHKKGKNDAARAHQLGKASKAIIVASKACNGDPTDMRLQSAIAHAKSMQLPKDRIDEAISKWKGADDDANNAESVRYDAMMSLDGSRVACIVTALTDNRNRTAPKVRAIVHKMGGELLQSNTNDYIFNHVGQILVANVGDEDAFLLVALEAGATNVEPADDLEDGDKPSYVVSTEDTGLFAIAKSLRDEHGYHVAQFEHSYILLDPEHGGTELSEQGVEELEQFLEKLEENDDVTNVYHNASY